MLHNWNTLQWTTAKSDSNQRAGQANYIPIFIKRSWVASAKQVRWQGPDTKLSVATKSKLSQLWTALYPSQSMRGILAWMPSLHHKTEFNWRERKQPKSKLKTYFYLFYVHNLNSSQVGDTSFQSTLSATILGRQQLSFLEVHETASYRHITDHFKQNLLCLAQKLLKKGSYQMSPGLLMLKQLFITSI